MIKDPLSPDLPQNAYKLPSLEMSSMGHDSEFFLWDTRKQQVVPSYLYYPMQDAAKSWKVYKKKFKQRYKKPSPTVYSWAREVTPSVTSYNTPVKIFRDGLAVEVNVSPGGCRAYMWNDTKGTLLKGEPPRMAKHLAFTTRPWVAVTPKMMDKFPPDLKTLGCVPALDAYKQKQKVVSVDPEKTFFRTAGAHLHMSFQGFSAAEPVPQECWSPFIKLADATLGLASVAIFGDKLERARRKLYGQAGEFRFQASYGGLEYRALSSRIWDHQALWSLFAGIWKYALGGALYRDMWRKYDLAWQDDIQQAINEVDPDMAFKLLETTKPLLQLPDWNYTPTTVTKTDLPSICKKLRELFLRGFFPDCGVWSRPWAPEGHTGFKEYWTHWCKEAPENIRDNYGI